MWRAQLFLSLILLSYRSIPMEKPRSQEESIKQEKIAQATEAYIEKLQQLKHYWAETLGMRFAQIMLDLQLQTNDFTVQPGAAVDDYTNFIDKLIEKKIAELLPNFDQHTKELIGAEKDLALNAARLMRKSDNLREAGKRTLALQTMATSQTALFEEFITLRCYQELRNPGVIKEIGKIAQKTLIDNKP